MHLFLHFSLTSLLVGYAFYDHLTFMTSLVVHDLYDIEPYDLIDVSNSSLTHNNKKIFTIEVTKLEFASKTDFKLVNFLLTN